MNLLRFSPLLRQIRWGGTRLGTELGKPTGDAEDYAESWEISDQPGFESVVASGSFAGTSLRHLIRNHSRELLGSAGPAEQFPLLIKFLDANDWLSLQVHPNDEQASASGADQRGKTEAWVILDAAPDSRICAGLRAGVTRSDLEHHLYAGTTDELLHLIPARAGDCIFVPAGTVHALGPGILLAEIQQQSDLTFRLHDWGRTDSNGQPRELHVDKALDCIDFGRGPVDPVIPVQLSSGDHSFEELVRCPHFVLRRHSAVDTFALKTDNRFRILMMLSGESEIQAGPDHSPLAKGQTVLVPAVIPEVVVQPRGRITLLEILCP